MNVHVPPQWEAVVRREIESGRFADAESVVEEALRLLDERARRDRLRAAIAAGDADLARGDVVEWTPDLLDQLKREAADEDRRGLPIDDDVLP